jgi:LmbE family N-acetylglucosaminyl deacetylase
MPVAELGRVLVIMAHPDDPDFFCGGTIARFADEGKEICYLLATSGDKGSAADPSLPREGLVARREAEQLAAAETLGVQEVVFLHHRDGELVSDLSLRRQLVRFIRLYRPDIIVTTDPLRYFAGDRRLNHPDHRAIGDAALGAVFPAAGNPLCCPELEGVEGLAPHTPDQLLIAGPDQPNHTVDITDTIERKMAAILEHKSQLADPEASLARVRQRSLQEDGRYVEHFRRILLR